MKTLRIIGGVLLGLLALYLVLCLAGPKEVNIARSIEIKAPAARIYGFLEDFREWNRWSYWHQADTTMVHEYSGPEKGLGSINAWTSKKMGTGSQEIIEAEPYKHLRTRLQFSGWGGYSYSDLDLEEASEGCMTKVTWTMEGDQPTPFFFRGMLLLMNFKGSIIRDYDTGLANLKKLSEELSSKLSDSYRGYPVKEFDFPGATYAGVRQELPVSEITSFFGASYGKIMAAMQKARLTPAGAPSGLYYVWDEAGQKTDLAAGIPVNAAAQLEGVDLIELPAGKAIAVDYYGPYSGSGEAHYALDDYLNARCWKFRGPAVEEYITDPGMEPDTMKWLTRIIYFYE